MALLKHYHFRSEMLGWQTQEASHSWSSAPVSKTGMPQGIVSSNLTASAKIRNSNFRQKYGRHEVPSVLNSPQKILNLKGFATLRVAQKVRFELQ